MGTHVYMNIKGIYDDVLTIFACLHFEVDPRMENKNHIFYTGSIIVPFI